MSGGLRLGRCGYCNARIPLDDDYCSPGCAHAAQQEDEEMVMAAVTDQGGDVSGGEQDA